jgi:hypothetical protein
MGPFMTRREKSILYTGAAVVGLMILLKGLPVAGGIYAERKETIAVIRDDIAREQNLAAATDLWRERKDTIDIRLAELEAQVFETSTLPLLTANLQRMVRQYANDADISITSTKLAEPLQTDGWLLVEQELSFTMDNQSNSLGFLRRLEESQPWLGVTSFTMRRNRNQYSGSVTVVGFSRIDPEVRTAVSHTVRSR